MPRQHHRRVRRRHRGGKNAPEQNIDIFPHKVYMPNLKE
jgi:hypothetical protein